MEQQVSNTVDNSFLDLSSESLNKLDEVFNSDSVKQFLSDSKSLENLAAAILENEAPATSSLSTTSTVTMSNSAPGHVATVQEGLDLVDALDSLVNQLTNQPQSTSAGRPGFRDVPPEVDLLGGNLEIGSSTEETWVDSISLDHSYACVAVKQRVPHRRDSQIDYDMSGASSSPTTPQRRSQRQIEKIEKSVLERIKAENQELLKREREEMGGGKRSRDSLEDTLVSQDEEETVDDDGLVIDVDDKKQSVKKKPRKKKRISETSVPVTTSQRKAEDELENVIAALSGENVENKKSTADDRKSSAGRSQRQRRKPKRWDDDEVEVDFSGNASELGMESSSSMKKVIVKREQPEEDVPLMTTNEIREKIAKEVDSDDDEGSEWGSDDDPDKLWCICRQPHNNRFMICCDGCEDWFHGTCVGVTKKQGRICEQEKRKWFCAKCREAGKRDDRMFIPSSTVVSTSAASETKDEKGGVVKRKPSDVNRDETKKVKKVNDEQKKRNDFRLKIGKPKGLKVPVASAEKKEEEKLKKLIKNKKIEFKKKFKKEKEEKESEWEPISKVVTVVRKPEDKKKKFKEQSIDLSFQDLFKAEPLTMKRSGSTSGGSNSLQSPATTPVTPTTPKFASNQQPPLKRPSISGGDQPSSLSHQQQPQQQQQHQQQSQQPSTALASQQQQQHPQQQQQQQQQPRKASVSSNEPICVTCNKVVHNKTQQKSSSVYCSDVCIEKHVKELLELLKQTRTSSITSKTSEKRVVVIERSTGKLLAGGNAILEDRLLEFIKSHPSFEVLRPQTNIVSRKSSVDSNDQKRRNSEVQQQQQQHQQQQKMPLMKRNEEKSMKKEENVQQPKTKPKLSPSDTNNDYRKEMGADSIRNNVRKALRDTLTARCNEVNDLKNIKDEDIKKIASKIEEEMYQYFNKDTSGKYRTRYRSLVFNLKDSKNQGLFRKVLTGKIEPSRLVRMSPEELASPELAKWRERENKHTLEMIKRDAEQQAQQVIVKKTHKGEELIETKAKKEIDVEAGQNELHHKDKEKNDTSLQLNDLNEDTTSKHGQHVFDLRCEICTNKQSSRKKSRTSDEQEQPKRVRVELDEPTNKILQEAVKLSSKTTTVTTTASSSSSRDSFDQSEATTHSTTTTPPPTSLPPPPPPPQQQQQPVEPVVKVSQPSCWKGTIYMQDVAKFVSSAFKISGAVEVQDLLDVIQVCGRIAPEQVLDYIKKLKYSSRSEISVVRFHPSSHDEKMGYDAFFAYLNSRKRYGVVGNNAKCVKDFYILPLPKDVDPPEVLLPFNGPGLEKRHHRQNLLLGIIVKSKKVFEHKSKHKDPRTQTSSSESNVQSHERSYTPPPPLKTDQNSNTSSSNPAEEEPYDPANSLTPPLQMKSSSSSTSVSYTPPRETEERDSADRTTTAAAAVIAAATTATTTTTALTSGAADEEPYDPEDNNSSSNSSNVVDLLEKITKSTNPNEVTSTILSTIANSATIEQQKQLLNELTNKVEESKKQLEEQRRAAEAAFNIATSSAKNVSGGIPGLDGSFADETQLQIPNIQLPDNLKEILETVQRKTQEQEKHKGNTYTQHQ
ncbi:death-inducer obliterator 1-like protein [Leptotrombidium deliense]|uniref:Death-inducer obliterator 1-like protein n=1 Tax=Leptotrombidium deliense TaxID=299467 RepID=A0A443SEM3_9ACAR|nr:death-inducer obliterator 1-like protein [Leptotrombidium deliense]